MKSIVFTQEQLGNLEEIGKQLWESEDDPASASYVRTLHRPKIKWASVALYVLLWALFVTAAVVAVRYFAWSFWLSAAIVAAVALLYLALTIKLAVIGLVKLYQRFAPDAVRNKCRFEPSCSEYMLLAIEKYGFFKGVRKGIDRLKRCNVNNGGYDYP